MIITKLRHNGDKKFVLTFFIYVLFIFFWSFHKEAYIESVALRVTENFRGELIKASHVSSYTD